MSENALMELGKFNGVRIAARPTDRYINATQMCKAAGKRWPDYWRMDQAQDFVKALSSSVQIHTDELVWSKAGRPANGGGTWVHLDVAIHLAQWCSPEFAVWVSRQIRNLFETGKALVPREHSEAVLYKAIGDIGTALVGITDIQKDQGCKINRIEGLAVETYKIATETKKDVQGLQDLVARRAHITQATQRSHLSFIYNRRNGYCPCCSEMKIVDESGNRIRGMCEFDHFKSKTLGSIDDVWPVCPRCNSNLRSTNFKSNAETKFNAYHADRVAYKNSLQRWLPFLEEATP